MLGVVVYEHVVRHGQHVAIHVDRGRHDNLQRQARVKPELEVEAGPCQVSGPFRGARQASPQGLEPGTRSRSRIPLEATCAHRVFG